MEADVVRWLQSLRHTVTEESDPPWSLFSARRRTTGVRFDSSAGSDLDRTVDALFDFDRSTTSAASDFEYYGMATTDDDDVFVPFPVDWTDVKAWKNELLDSALDDAISSEDEQVSRSFPRPATTPELRVL